MIRTSNIELDLITEIVKVYFDGTYQGDKDQLKLAFHTDARVTGNFNGTICDWSLSDFLTRVTSKPTAAEKNEPYDKKIIYIDHNNNVAMVKARVVVGDNTFIDYITLLKIDGRWLIRNKSFTTIERGL